MTRHQNSYAGRVYDGPLEGEYHAIDRPFFGFNFSPDSYLSPIGAEMLCGSTISPYLYRMLYRWSNPLRCWVFDWRTAPQPKAPAPPKRDLYARNIRYEKRSRGGAGWEVC